MTSARLGTRLFVDLSLELRRDISPMLDFRSRFVALLCKIAGNLTDETGAVPLLGSTRALLLRMGRRCQYKGCKNETAGIHRQKYP